MNLSQLGNALIALGVLCFGAVGVSYFQDYINSQMPNIRSCRYEEISNRYRIESMPVTLIVVPPGGFYDSSLQIAKAGKKKKRNASLYFYIAKDYDYTHSDGLLSKSLRADPHQGVMEVQIGSENRTFDFSELPSQYNTWTWKNVRQSGAVKFKALDRCMALFVYTQ